MPVLASSMLRYTVKYVKLESFIYEPVGIYVQAKFSNKYLSSIPTYVLTIKDRSRSLEYSIKKVPEVIIILGMGPNVYPDFALLGIFL